MRTGWLAAGAVLAGSLSLGQEAPTGFELSTTLTTGAFYSHQLTQYPRDGSPIDGGFRALLYPTWKLSSHWAFTGVVQERSRPFFAEEFSTQDHGLRTDVLQAHLDYSRFANKGSIVVRVGMLPTAFGSFLSRYDDTRNPVTQTPAAYGYYYKPVTTMGLMGAQVDATLGGLDFRAQFVNSSPANRRSIFDREQYGSWAGGAGYTILQGFRVGVSAFRGSYLDRHYPFYFPGEKRPRGLPGSGYGIDVSWGHGPWNVNGELQRFQMIYRAIPDFNEHTGYAEVRRVLSPRWYVAERAEYVRANAFPGYQTYETAVGFRPDTRQLIKVGYQIQQGPAIRGSLANVAEVQVVTTLPSFSVTR
jgi:hypothetical protein